ncbi:hypothetical protein BGW38_003249 [Lunasporangiospora selenospora]|uniref:Uncharacterized protein n=1 Tax=Lunasporangiospora selenospora TaxID=979761 RepID=A0A9P6FQW7_9FUNG|nr:hypothetical protein BGW38_003249 [Lunasporangiospora selenospora]
MKRPSSFILSAALAALLFILPAAPQRFSAAVEQARIFSDGGTTVGADKNDLPLLRDPIIRSSETVENAVENAYWIDFHDDFTDREMFTQFVENHPGITLRHAFWDTALNAVSVDISDLGILQEIIDRINGIKLVEPVIKHERPEAIRVMSDADPDTIAKSKPDIHAHTGVRDVHKKFKAFGNGIKIGIVDSGVDYLHPALGGCFGPGCKVAYGADFVGDDGRSPSDDPRSECDGHGTHVAGIIAANDTNFIGVAPQATLGAYRVFGCKGGTSNDLIIKAMLRAASDGMQVINLSLGGPGGWRQEREARVADALAKNGTIIVAAMGNEGDMGLFEASSPGVAESLITVASTENYFRTSRYFTVDEPASTTSKRSDDDGDDGGDDDSENRNDGHEAGRNQNEPAGANSKDSRAILFLGDYDMDFSNAQLVQLAPGTSGQVKADGCMPISKDLKNKLVLIRRGDCTFKVKIDNAALAGASGVIIMDNVKSDGLSADTGGANIKVVTISLADGEYLLQTIKMLGKDQQGIQLKAGDGAKSIPNKNGGFMSTFSSLGPDSELNLKPDISAPGGMIWSTYPIKMGSYASLSGTSMATPYITGCVALYLQGLPNADHSAEAIKAAFQNTGRPRMEQVGFTGPTSTVKQGAGLLDLLNVFTSQVSVTPSYLALNDTVNLNAKQTFTIRNSGSAPIQYKLDLLSAAGLDPFSEGLLLDKDPLKVKAEASADFSQQTIVVKPRSSVTVDVTFSGPDTDPSKFIIYSGFVRFTPSKVTSKTPLIHVPFMGMQGSYKDMTILDPMFGVRVFDSNARPLRPQGSHGYSDDDDIEMSGDVEVTVEGSLNDRINSIPDRGEYNSTLSPPSGSAPPQTPPDEGHRHRRNLDKAIIVFRMVTACNLLVLDLVSEKGDDPYEVKSYGILNNGLARYVPRNDQMEGNVFQVVEWDGKVITANGTLKDMFPSKGGPVNQPNYRIRASLLKHFGNPESDLDFEAHLSHPFSLL